MRLFVARRDASRDCVAALAKLLAKKVIQQIGKELAEEPEFAPHILETLKMQGVEQFGDFAIQIRMKMMTKPGEQFAIRRQAYAMIKQRFSESGIQFAFPTVTVAGGSAETARRRQPRRRSPIGRSNSSHRRPCPPTIRPPIAADDRCKDRNDTDGRESRRPMPTDPISRFCGCASTRR